MSRIKCSRNGVSVVVLLILAATFLCVAPAFVHPERASAQGVICGGTFYPSGQVCGYTGGGVGVTCDGIYYPTQTSCTSTLGVTCGGIYYPSGQICGNTGSVGVTCNSVYFPNLSSCPTSTTYVSCPDGSLVATSQSCPGTTSTCPNGSVIPAGSSCPVTTIACPGTTAVLIGQSCPSTAGTQYCNGTYVPAGTCSARVTATYPAGWNLVGGPTGTVLSGVSGSLYMLTPGSSSYVALPPSTPLQGGTGYWTLFASTTTVTLAATSTSSATVPLPAGPFVLVGNPSDAAVSVSGYGAVVLVYNPTNGMYAQTNQLAPGQGAWAASAAGGQLSISAGPGPAGGPPPPPPPL